MIPLALATGVAIAGILLVAVRDAPIWKLFSRRGTDYAGFWLLLFAGLVTMALVIYRTDLLPSYPNMLIYSVMRHASAGRVALSALLAIGLLRWVPLRHQRIFVSVAAITLFFLNVYIIFNVQFPYQHCALPDALQCLSTIR